MLYRNFGKVVLASLFLLFFSPTQLIAEELYVFDPKGFLRYSGAIESEQVLLVEVEDISGFPVHEQELLLHNESNGAALSSTSYRGQALFKNLSPGTWQISGNGDNPLKVKNVTLTASLLPIGTGGSGAATGAGGIGAPAGVGAPAGAGAPAGVAAGAGAGAGAGAAGVGAAGIGGLGAAGAVTLGTVAVAGTVIAVEEANDSSSGSGGVSDFN